MFLIIGNLHTQYIVEYTRLDGQNDAFSPHNCVSNFRSHGFSGSRCCVLSKLIIGIGAFGGSTLGGYIPALWGGGMLASFLISVIGGIAGIVLAYRLGKTLDLF